MRIKKIILCACLICGAGPAIPAEDWAPVGDAVLDEMRGGFDAGNGLMMSLGIERLVSINGTVVSSTSFNIADLSRLSSEEASLARSALTSLNLLQNGAGNTFLAGPMPQSMAGTVIQNSLNDQLLRTQTVINTSVNSLELLKLINFQDSLQNALGNVAGVK